jgi:signal transduction histidine kinase
MSVQLRYDAGVPRYRTGRPRGTWALLLVGALFVVTWASFRHNGTLVITRRIEVAVLLAGFGAVASALAAYVAVVGFLLRGRQRDLLAASGFLVLAGSNVVVLAQLIQGGAARHQAAADVAFAVLGVAAAVCFAASPVISTKLAPAARLTSAAVAATVVLIGTASLTIWSLDSTSRDHTAASILLMIAAIVSLAAAGLWWRLPNDGAPVPGMAYLVGTLGFLDVQWAVHPPQSGVTDPAAMVALLFGLGTLLAVLWRTADDAARVQAYSLRLEGVRMLSASTAEADVATLSKHITRTVGDLLGAEVRMLTDEADTEEPSHASEESLISASRSGTSGSRFVVAIERGEDGRISVGVPLATHGRKVGTLVAGRPADLGFTPSEIALLEVCASQASLLLERSMLHEDAAAGAVMEERSRLAREVHDGLAQHLAFLKMRVAWLRRSPSAVNVDQLEDVEQVLEAALQEARQAITTLRAEPQGESTAEAIAGYASEFGQISGMSVHVIHDASVPEVGPKARVELLRIVQEALNNARKHAGASRIDVQMRARGRGIEVTIADNGSGFNTDRREAGHFGIEIMRERAESIGGHFDLTSSSEGGTRIRVWVPALEAPGGSDRRAG